MAAKYHESLEQQIVAHQTRACLEVYRVNKFGPAAIFGDVWIEYENNSKKLVVLIYTYGSSAEAIPIMPFLYGYLAAHLWRKNISVIERRLG